jgi:Flp pilus assembly protein TadD/class 3 adenylate cyclase
MGRYLAVLFADLERHTEEWGRLPRDRMVEVVAEYRYVAERLAGHYGSLYSEWAGDGHMFLFDNVDTAAQFGLRLVDGWARSGEESPALERFPHLPLRLGCHFGECTEIAGGHGWIGRGNAIAKRVESEAEPDSLYVTETVLDLLDLPLYEFAPAGSRTLKGDHVPRRSLYRLVSFDQGVLDARAPEELSAGDWFRKALALLGTERENSEEEADSLRQAIRLQPDYPEAHNNLAILLRRTGDESAAARHYQEALRLRPDYPEAHSNYAALLAARGSAGAEEHYREAIRLRPSYADAYHRLANLLASRERVDEALVEYENALRVRPDYPEAHNDYAVLLDRVGRPEEAERHYREALWLGPDVPEAHYNYALLLEGRDNPEAAEEHYRTAIRLRPDYGEAHNNLAVLLHLKGELAEAEEHYLKALEARPDDPEAHYNFGLLLRARGDEQAARRELALASELAPEHD